MCAISVATSFLFFFMPIAGRCKRCHPDDENVVYCTFDCEYNIDNALRRVRSGGFTSSSHSREPTLASIDVDRAARRTHSAQ